MSHRSRRPPIADAEQPWYEFKAQAEADSTVAELHIFGVIGASFWDPDAISGKKIAEQLAGLPDEVKTVRVYVNSPGGNVFDGQHIFNALRRQREDHNRAVEVDIEGMALSAATLVTSAGGSLIGGASGAIRMPANAIYMVHNPYLWTVGDAEQLRKDAGLLDRITSGIIATYKWCSEVAEDVLRELMSDETWMGPDEALEKGFVTEVVEPVAAQAAFDPELLDRCFDIPEEYRDRVMALVGGQNEEPGDTDDGDADRDDDAADAAGAGGDEGDASEPADAAMVARVCSEGGCPSLAAGLIESGASEAAVNTAVARAKRIVQLCEAAELPELAEGYITNGVAEDAVREQLSAIAARMDSAEISSNIAPGARERPKAMSVREIYAERNKAHFKTTRQET